MLCFLIYKPGCEINQTDDWLMKFDEEVFDQSVILMFFSYYFAHDSVVIFEI